MRPELKCEWLCDEHGNPRCRTGPAVAISTRSLDGVTQAVCQNHADGIEARDSLYAPGRHRVQRLVLFDSAEDGATMLEIWMHTMARLFQCAGARRGDER